MGILGIYSTTVIPEGCAQVFNPELVIPIGIPSKEAKAEIETHPVISEVKLRKGSSKLEFYKPFCAFYSSIEFALFLQGNNFLFYFYILLSKLLTHVFFRNILK